MSKPLSLPSSGGSYQRGADGALIPATGKDGKTSKTAQAKSDTAAKASTKKEA
ncbi:hypothetical protein [Acidimangrovimonas sediminis]|uniref:hypothetical protein n=1 Tax=Acidimangrovimonas sediminis TaxID=2056283 RepID=UPI0013047E6C|nr:hypothetical protein [Acidimangrovimonas sediminis]